jgi:parallel beta-helix repeat protein
MERSEHISTKAIGSSKLLAILVLALVLTAILVLGIVLMYSPTKLSPTTWDVYPGQSIQAVLDSARPGDTIIVHTGVYNQSVVITKSINLIGDGAILDGTLPADPGTNLKNSSITIEQGVSDIIVKNFEIRNYLNPDGNGIQAWNDGTSNIKIINNVIYNVTESAILVGNNGTGLHENWYIGNNTVYKNVEGIYVAHVKNVVISNNTVEESFWSGIWVGTEPGSTFNSEHIDVINNTVTNSGSGIYVLSSSEEAELKDITITGNTVSDCNGDGIVVLKLSEECRNSRDVFISNNRVDNSFGAGILLEGVSYGEVLENELTNNNLGGIVIVLGSNNIIVKMNLVLQNGILFNKAGIHIQESNNNTVVWNTVRDNGRGIVRFSPDGEFETSYNIIAFNTAKDNVDYDLFDEGAGTGNIWEFNIYDTKNW